MRKPIEAWMDALASRLVCKHCPAMNTRSGLNLPGQRSIQALLRQILSTLFPGCLSYDAVEETSTEAVSERLRLIAEQLASQVERVEQYRKLEGSRSADFDCKMRADQVVRSLLERLPEVRAMLQADLVAAYEGDPAAHSNMEIVMAYPGFFAIAVHRIAHVLYALDVHVLPRVMSEYAHTLTGIDIHPGAKIGKGFFIDHGTGVVIGETCVIGENVRIYQGVTLGALSFRKDAQGHLVKGGQRHPRVEDDVIIYANATILGGDTVIGRGSVIGGNVWLTHSVAPGSRLFYEE
jgi:serine O-acetyltransferase